MPDSERLPELRRQRQLVQEQLAWIDGQIAAASAQPAAPPPAVPVAGSPPVPPAPRSAASEAEAEALLAQLSQGEEPPRPLSKRGCWFVFLGLLLAGGAVIVGLIYHFYR